ncbi:pirin family protein [Marinomonas agarivorans]|nr:pirin family protein [Marinomonas agarivorans]
MSVSTRELKYVTSGQMTSDGDGVKLVRLIGNRHLDMLDPFLLMDVFSSDEPQDYIGGFPPHPHRGFETVTYMLAGLMRHKDGMGNEGVIGPYDVQWMTAGRGIIHSEMPEQENGLLMGIQLWINLPQKEKMCLPNYQDYSETQIPVDKFGACSSVRVIAGKRQSGITGPVKKTAINPIYMDVSLAQSDTFLQELTGTDNSFLYVIEGEVMVGDSANHLRAGQLGILTHGEQIKVMASTAEARFILLAGTPLNEPVVKGGPFVMNTQEEVAQAFVDFRANRF